MIGVILFLVGSIVSLAFLRPELYNKVGDGQYYIDTMSVDKTIGFQTLSACIRKNI
jgi:hypothetical protein